MTQTGTTPARFRLALGAVTAMLFVLALSWASPAAAFIEEDPADEATVQQAPAEEDTGGANAGDGFVEVESAPTGGVDAGFGGTADGGAGLGLPHAVAAALLALTAAAHVTRNRKVATVDA